MQIIADLQLHSKYSRAVSQKMDLYEIERWAAMKGINLVATGDWTHPLWFREIKANLEEVSNGLYKLKGQNTDVRFLLSTEISSIYSHRGQTRRVHNLLFSPSIEICGKIIDRLTKQGCNLMADGRPIVGLSSKELLELVLDVDPHILFIPAHAWTPWFAIFGSKSGYDSIDECFEELSGHIYAIETGLSSDPAMNWQIDELKNRSIVSFSDAHSGPKLGREATVFVTNSQQSTSNSQLDYNDIVGAIKQEQGSKLKIGYTIEFFPEEGKYHLTGHRECDVKYTPEELRQKGSICPVCKRPLTVGVEKRVWDLSSTYLTKEDLLLEKNKQDVTFVYDKEKKRRPFVSLVPLLEILHETTPSKPKAEAEYERLTSSVGTEFDILLHLSYEKIESQGGPALSEAIKKVRSRDVTIDPGYDGVFGKVSIFKDVLKNHETTQATLF